MDFLYLVFLAVLIALTAAFLRLCSALEEKRK
jgi:hypothetical protein